MYKSYRIQKLIVQSVSKVFNERKSVFEDCMELIADQTRDKKKIVKNPMVLQDFDMLNPEVFGIERLKVWSNQASNTKILLSIPTGSEVGIICTKTDIKAIVSASFEIIVDMNQLDYEAVFYMRLKSNVASVDVSF